MDAQIPDWIKQREMQNALAAARGDAKIQRANAASMRVKHEGPGFWRDLSVELKANLDALALSSLGVRGGVSSFDNAQTQEQTYRIQLIKKGSIAGTTYIDLFYCSGDSKIRSLTLDGDSRNYVFCVSDVLAVMPEDEFVPKTTKEVAKSLIESMLDRVCEGD
jgi:hypothetical protein